MGTNDEVARSLQQCVANLGAAREDLLAVQAAASPRAFEGHRNVRSRAQCDTACGELPIVASNAG